MHFLMKKPNSSHKKSVVIQKIIPHHTKGFPRKIKPPYFHLWAYKDHEKAFKKKVMTLASLLPRKLFLQMCNDPQSKAMKIYVSTTVICNESPPTWSNECYRGNCIIPERRVDQWHILMLLFLTLHYPALCF